MQDMLVGDAEFFFFISLLIFDDKVIKKYFIEFIQVLFQRDFDSLFSGLLVIL